MSESWSNWSGSVRARPERIARPRTESELAALVRSAAQVRAVGAGHSFMPLCETSGTLLQLDELEGRITPAGDGRSVWAPAGWSLAKLSQALWGLGCSLPNQDDINVQSLAGALATGTHGTGAELGSLSTFALGFRLMLADGSTVECSPEQRPELYQAARLSLGLVGIVLQIRVAVIPALHLEERVYRMPLTVLVEQFGSLAAKHRHAEFYIFPYANEAVVKTLHPDEDTTTSPPQREGDERLLGRGCDWSARLPWLTGPFQRLMTRSIKPTHRSGPAHRIFPSTRTVPFETMEYQVPRDMGLETLLKALAWVRKRRLPVTFPLEFRWVAGDDIWLSPFNRGPCASISMRQYAKLPWQQLFAQAEPIFRAAGGRPHWAKRHTLSAEDVRALYPKLAAFNAIRREVDPEGKFINAPLAQLFEIR
ncbi:D-arabinono-1,4-lactone oxidase [Steroidobacter sp.]|uniref:D-arabinono-1,4-lactone oxidase n=1 Tax=Steroidobacter sp. TaxID=1978227 RepID=UPI001A580A4C|nr:D-arabinono-1,4-lactone oxidase [Steroidobacter sp.]MBL8267329.1 FAD-binding protein [Steroidobacter sp.]